MVKPTYSSPQEYIEERRKHFDPRPSRRKDIMAPYFDAEDLEKYTLEDDTDFAECLMDRLRPRFPKFLVDILSKVKVAVGLVNDPSPNAHLVSLDCGHAIIFNAGLMEFIYRVTRALSTRFAAPEDDVAACPPGAETCRIIYEVFDWYVGSWQRTGKEHAAGPHYQVNRTQFRLANELAFEAECFFLAHELGHLLCELSRTSALDLSAMRGGDEDEETFADKFAFWVLMSAWHDPESKYYHPDLAFAGAFTALRMFEALHGYCESAYKEKFGGPHPDAGWRVVNLVNWTRQLYRGDEKAFERVTGLASMIDFTLTAVEYAFDLPEFEEYYTRGAAEVVSELDELLTACTSDEHISDHVTFRERAHPLLKRGYPMFLMDRVAREIVLPLQASTGFSKEGFGALPDEEKADARRKVRKLLLLFGLAKELREPYESVWLQVINLDPNCRLVVCEECGRDYLRGPAAASAGGEG
jgi:hypothetical protein